MSNSPAPPPGSLAAAASALARPSPVVMSAATASTVTGPSDLSCSAAARSGASLRATITRCAPACASAWAQA
jgi:hypothetical protein